MPLHEAVPPKLYGGTERVVAYLSDALVDLGAVEHICKDDALVRAVPRNIDGAGEINTESNKQCLGHIG